MIAVNRRVSELAQCVHQHFLWLLVGAYVVAAVCPAFGLWVRGNTLGEIAVFREPAKITAPALMLALLLVNAGLGVQTSQLRDLIRRPAVLIVGLAANLLTPIAFIFGASQGMRYWHNPEEVQHILVGLALVASMPIAGSSTAWSQNANGNLALSLGLVLLSTLMSPLTTPFALHSVGLMAKGEYAGALHDLAGHGTGAFLVTWVLLPSILGIVIRGAVGEAHIDKAKPLLKLVNFANLLVLNYSNASVSLPQVVASPDWDFLAVILGNVAALCAFNFVWGWLIARLLRLDSARKASLLFGLGLSNNGTGLVLASMTLSAWPQVMLPIIFYNLVQHLGAASVDLLLTSRLRRAVARSG